MSDNDNTGASRNVRSGWSEHEILVCLISALDQSGIKLGYAKLNFPAGRTASGFKQKFNHLQKSLKPELDAINSGVALPDAASTPVKKAGGDRKRKLKNEDDANGDETTKKRGRPKKNTTSAEEDSEALVKNEPEGEVDVEVEEEM